MDVNVAALNSQVEAESKIKQFRDFLVQYNKLSENCFRHCALDMTVRTVRGAEDSCITNCVEKYTKVTQRVMDRFTEIQMLSTENTKALEQKLLGK